jgi:hypothetical protein
MSPFVIQGEAGFGSSIGTSRVGAKVVIKQNVARACRDFYWCCQACSRDVSIELPHIFVFVWMSRRESLQLTVRSWPDYRAARVLRHAVQINETADKKWWWKAAVCILLQGMIDVGCRPLPRIGTRKDSNRVRRLWRCKSRATTRYRCRR